MDLRQRFELFAARFAEARRTRGGGDGASPFAFSGDYWESIQDLFTRDVTGRGLRELIQIETRDAYHFFTRELDFSALADKPWYKRYPLAAWILFLAMAYRLSPPRRILFAIAVPVMVLGYLRYLLDFSDGRSFDSFAWLLLGATLLFVLLVMELKDKLTLKGDLEVARQIQFGLLPFEPYHRSGVAIDAAMRPANTVGGDYFDIIELSDGSLAVALGDVAGKGMPAALLMALLQASLRTLLTAGLRGADLLRALNKHLLANIPSNRLVTLFYGELAERGGELRYVNAGHNPPFLLRKNGGVERLPATAMALGVVATDSYALEEIRLGEGDRLVLYTDGITEASNTQDVEYGEARLQEFLARHDSGPRRTVIDALIADAVAFCGAERPRDDMTVMLVERDTPAAPPPRATGIGGAS